jgi:hypothetical protein
LQKDIKISYLRLVATLSIKKKSIGKPQKILNGLNLLVNSFNLFIQPLTNALYLFWLPKVVCKNSFLFSWYALNKALGSTLFAWVIACAVVATGLPN